MLNTQNEQIIYPGFAESATDTAESIYQNQQIQPKLALLNPLRIWLDTIDINNRSFAKLIAKLIPAQCPFERKILLMGREIAHIPPLCKLNPLYDQFIGLRFRALCYLVDVCGEDITSYC